MTFSGILLVNVREQLVRLWHDAGNALMGQALHIGEYNTKDSFIEPLSNYGWIKEKSINTGSIGWYPSKYNYLVH